MSVRHFALMVCACCAWVGVAQANLVTVGSGVNQAKITIEWEDGYRAEFLVHFGGMETDTLTGLELLDIVEAETGLTTVREDFGFGPFVDEISFEGHISGGFGGGDLWWHYWVGDGKDDAAWRSSATGASGRTLGHGDADGWIYGHGEPPISEHAMPFYAGYKDYVYDANDFATEVVEYLPVAMHFDWITETPFDDPQTALGRPTVDTDAASWFLEGDSMPIVPVYPPFRSFELTWLGEGGSMTLAFNHPVRNDVHNPYGIDFIVFGNSYQVIGGQTSWRNEDPRTVTVGPLGGREPGVVSVSQDGVTWYSFTTDPNFMAGNADTFILPAEAGDGPFADSFAPTLGRVYDPKHPDPSLGVWNQWWGGATNPTLPVDPALNYASFGGRSVARIAETYGPSAGGTGFDIDRLGLPVDPNTGMKWFKYVRIDDVPGGGHPEIDAVADVTAPGDYRHPAPAADITGDFCVDLADAAMVAEHWGTEEASADINGSGLVGIDDLVAVLDQLGICVW